MSCPRSLKVFDTVASQVSALSFVDIFNFCVFLTFTICYTYQLFYVLVVLTRRAPKKVARANHRYAVMVAARNEETVIADLIHSIKVQNYPAELIDIFVIADNCTDNTADVAREAGAIVFPRSNDKLVGKGYALDYGLKAIWEQYADRDYEAFFVFDADNVLDVNYFREMNKTFDNGAVASTSYRNSKNFDSSWISAANALWFMREAKFLNNARMMVGTSCAISGSGWLVSGKIIKGMHGWDFHTLTEDIQFSTFCCANNIQIGYAPAEFFDEQPVTFKASWVQRLRWTKGFYQVFFSYCRDLFHGIRHGRFASYDMLMTIAPGMILTLLSAFVNATYLIVGSLSHGFIATQAELSMCVGSLIMTFFSMYFVFFLLAIITTISERKHIHCHKSRRWIIFTNLFTFPLFMMTYIPMTVVALFKKVEWIPTKHDIAVNVEDVLAEDASK